MTRLVHAELRKLSTTRTARVLLALAGAGTAALIAVVLLLAVAVALFAVLGTGLAALLRNQVAALIVGLLWWS